MTYGTDAIEKEQESPPAKRPKFGTREMPINPLSDGSLISVLRHAPEAARMRTHTHTACALRKRTFMNS